MRGSPWEPVPGSPGTEIKSRIAPDKEEKDVIPREDGEEKEVRLKEFRIERKDVFDNGPTRGCPGCDKVITGGIARNHSKTCRSRFEKIFIDKGNPKLLRQAKRFMAEDEDVGKRRDEREIPEMKKEDEEMRESDPEEEDEEMGQEDHSGEIEGMVFSLHPDQGVRDSIIRIRDKVENAKRSKSWKDGIEEMTKALDREGIRDPIMEVYSPPRVNSMANALGIASGLSLDLTENDPEDGTPWDFTRKEKRDKAMDMVLGKRALLLIGSPLCTAFSRLQNWNFSKMSKERKEEIVNAGREHLKFCMLLYRIQHENGMYFLHEHPHSATSWEMPEVKEVLGLEGVEMVSHGEMTAEGYLLVKGPLFLGRRQ